MADNAVEDYGWVSAAKTQSTSYITPQVRRLLEQVGAKRVADLGCGNGSLSGELAAAGYSVVGIEYDAHGVDIARKAYPGVKFYQHGVQDDPKLLLDSEVPFDAVVSAEVVEHLFSPHLLPTYAHAILRRGGHLIVTTPYHGYLKNLAIALLGKWDTHHTVHWHGGHIKFWSRKTLTELLERNGFQVQAFAGAGRFPYLWKSMVLLARRS